MNAAFGRTGVLLAFLAAVVGIVVSAVALRRQATGRTRPPALDARPYAGVLLAGAVLAVLAMERALVTHDFSIVYVADNNSRVTPLLYSITGLWSALAGSILLWGLALGFFTVALVWRYRRQAADAVVGWATLVMYCISAFFFGLMLGPADPFVTQGHVPTQGLGPNSLLQDNPLVAIHPPLLYLGFVGFSVPFAFAIGMLATGRVGDRWQIETRRWTLVAWTFLSVGIVLGAWWSYQVLGWGGFWGWDPVENAALLPWLCGTAYLHSVLVQERRGLMRVWNLSLSIATFALTILATFLTRSGVIESVHSFSESSLGPLLIGFFGVVVAVGFGLLAWRGDRMRSPGGIDAPLGREGAFLVNNVLFVGFAFVVLLGTLFPLLYEALEHQQVTVGAPYFNTVAIPVGIALLALMAVAPALSWRTMEPGVLWRRLAVPAWIGVGTVVVCVAAGMRGLAPLVAFGLGGFAASSAGRALVLSVRASLRRGTGAWRGLVGRANGGMIVHIGVVVLAVGITASTSFVQRNELLLRPGQTVVFDGHRFTYLRTVTVVTPVSTSTQALVRVDHAVYHPALTQFGGAASQAVGTPAIDSGFTGDVYLTFDAVGGATSGGLQVPAGTVAIGAVVEPLIAWIWSGGILVGLGGLLALVPGRRRRATDPVSLPPALVTEAPAAGGRDTGEPSAADAAGGPRDRGVPPPAVPDDGVPVPGSRPDVAPEVPVGAERP
jgi:cytochrome c-type biogenesis protein CcmF